MCVCVYDMSWILLLFVFVNLNVQNKHDVYSEDLLARLGVPWEVPGREEEAVQGRAVG